jgi:RNA polymerase sigma-70 factor (ECF subfamily)
VRRPDIREAVALVSSAEASSEGTPAPIAASGEPARPPPEVVERFHALYREHFDFVFRNLRRLGVPTAQVDDAVQDAFLVVLRQLHKLDANAHVRAWLFAIALRVARNYRRRQRRKEGQLSSVDADTLSASEQPDPFDNALKAHAHRVLHDFLDRIDDDKRSVFVMAELEQMTAPEIAAALGLNLNTVYARIRAARRQFALAVSAAKGSVDGPR